MRRLPLVSTAVAGVLLMALTGCSQTSNAASETKKPVAPATAVTVDSLPTTTWPIDGDPTANTEKAGLKMLGEEMLDVHYHAHLDIVAEGQHVIVPEQIGIDIPRQQISALHTHDASGIVHIESAKDIPFTVGQLFTEWGRPLSTTRVGPVSAGDGASVQVYVNGKKVNGDPAAIKFKDHDEIFIYLGKPDAMPTVPSSYTFE